MAEKPKFKLTVHLTGARKSVHDFFTLKSARHYAKGICNNQNTARIVLTGPGTSLVLFDADDELAARRA